MVNEQRFFVNGTFVEYPRNHWINPVSPLNAHCCYRLCCLLTFTCCLLMA